MKNVFRISVPNFCMLFLFAFLTMQAQETASLSPNTQEIEKSTSILKSYTVKGTVMDEENLPLGGVNIVLKGTKQGIITDLDGKFEWPNQLEEGDVLIFSYIGYNPQEYMLIKSETETIDISIIFDSSDISLMGELEVGVTYVSKRNIFQKIGDLFRK